MHRFRTEILIAVALVGMTLAAFFPVFICDFVNFDDGDYVKENRYVRAGLTRDSIHWAFTTFHASNWHPLTWLSLELDRSLAVYLPDSVRFHNEALPHHLTNLVLHIIDTLLLFVVLRWLTGTVWRSALVAALFAVHPLHVESVAWVAERKDVLSTLFWLLTMATYGWYAIRPGVARYLLVVVLFALGLMAKPMLVTLPFILLLMDWWPLQRSQKLAANLIEKVPLFAMSIMSCVVTVIAQQKAVKPLESLSIVDRLANTVVAYGGYLKQTFWPRDLCVLYPHPGHDVVLRNVMIAGAVLAAISLLVLWTGRARPYLLFGWLWYLGTLVPVIGLVQVGEQAMADRYTYVPLIGIFIILAWGLPDLLEALGMRPVVLVFLVMLVLPIYVYETHAQVSYWRTSETLWKHALEVDPDNATAHNNLGGYLLEEKKPDEAMKHFEAALKIRGGDFAKASNNRGLVLLQRNQPDEAAKCFEQALRGRPGEALYHANLSIARSKQKRYDEAMQSICRALELDDRKPNYWYQLSGVFLKLDDETGKREETGFDWVFAAGADWAYEEGKKREWK